MPTLRETLKELYDSAMEESRSPSVARQGSLSISQNEAAQLYAAAVARAAGARAPGSSMMPQVTPPTEQSMSGRLVQTPDSPSVSTTAAPASREAARPDLSSVLANLTQDQVIQGIVLSEILGKPVSRRRGSNRIGR